MSSVLTKEEEERAPIKQVASSTDEVQRSVDAARNGLSHIVQQHLAIEQERGHRFKEMRRRFEEEFSDIDMQVTKGMSQLEEGWSGLLDKNLPLEFDKALRQQKQATDDIVALKLAFLKELEQEIRQKVLLSALRPLPADPETKIIVNPSGRFVVGGMEADTGLTGRKLMVDAYGSIAPHGGGAFSGKDASKVDRSGAYMARYIAKNIVAAGLADRCLVTLAYAIGMAEPVMVQVDTYGTGKVCADDCLAAAIPLVFGLTPAQIIQQLRLKRPIFAQTAVYGHFGRKQFPWERTDKAELLRSAVI